MHPFQQFIERYTSLPLGDWEAISRCLVQRTIRKEEKLLEIGKICRHLWFLESGILRFFVQNEGVETTKFFTEAPYAFTSQQSFSNNIPAREGIEALEDCVVWQMSVEDAYRLLEMKSWNNFIRCLIQEVQSFTEEILEQMQSQTAEDRYKTMLLNEPELIQRIPLKHLASYLGIAPQSLSRIRKNITPSQPKLT